MTDLLSLAPVGGAFITALYALRGARLTARTALSASHTAPRIAAATAFMQAVERCRATPTGELLQAVRTASRQLTVVAFAQDPAAVRVKSLAAAIDRSLQTQVETRHRLSDSSAEKAFKALALALRDAQWAFEEWLAGHPDESDSLSDQARSVADEIEVMTDALGYIQQCHAEQTRAWDDGRPPVDVSEYVEALIQLEQDSRGSGTPPLASAIEPGHVRAERAGARYKHRSAIIQVTRDLDHFAEAAAIWLNSQGVASWRSRIQWKRQGHLRSGGQLPKAPE
ncbi:hypothetical protein ACFVZM_20940 [Streptomyces sioyaensis]|uniref:hypothetical protein n=1 Tax=Streptomyces sioyaensis TaxID=67364 RepID=UPI003674412D